MPHEVVRKDAPPADTIARIHAILESLGFAARGVIVHRWSAAPTCHSCHVRFANYPLFYANGKGVSPELAYAGALAEFMERLQCDVDFWFRRAGLIHCLPPILPCDVRPLRDVGETAPALAATDLAAVVRDVPVSVPFLQFLDVAAGTPVELPYTVLGMMTRTSGMCAGNTPEEALAHGLCEVFERHVLRQLETGRVAGLPTIPSSDLRLASAVVRRQLAEIESAGIDVVVKDGSLGGLFPVVGVILTDDQAGMCHVSFGSDPSFDAALSRCLTEAFQGTARLFRKLQAPNGKGMLDTYNNPQVLRERLLESVGPRGEGQAFGEPAGNREALDFALARVERAGLRAYARDFSLFGFPAYYVYVERLSALDDLTPEKFAHLSEHIDSVRGTLFRLAWASPAKVSECARVLYDELVRCSPTLEAQFANSVLRAPVAACVGLRPLLALMLLESGLEEEACVVLDWPPIAEPSAADPSSREAVRRLLPAYAEARRGAVSAGRLASALQRACGGGEAAAAKPACLAEPGAAEPLLLPRCASVYDCPSCPCRRYCLMDAWYRAARRLRERASNVDNASLLAVISRRGAPIAS